ncbi:TraR/DksA family transcriptional regulator [Ilumatobacter sp.]|uniref:TraR/DksA family transcriptional regulator n=1 Tax=Ilumatobacter sp. TaxID=1967498 RepID=UPI0030B1C2C5
MAAPKSSKSAKKSVAKKTAAKKAVAKRPVIKQAVAKKAARKATVSKTAAKKTVAKKTAANKTAAKKPVVKKTAAKKAVAKKPVVKKTVVKKTVAKKTAAKKTVAKKAAVKKTAAKKAVAKKAAVREAAVKKAAVNTTASKKAAVQKTASKKVASKKVASKKSAAKKAVDPATPRPIQTVPPKLAPKIKEKKTPFPSLLSNDVPEVVEVPKPRGTSKDGIAYTKDFDVKFLKAQKDELLARRAGELLRATRLEEEAISLIEDGEMGDVQFDDEGGEGDTMVVQRDLDRLLSGQARQSIGDIDEALARIEVGTYGYSVVSGKPIPRERLEAIPETTVLAVEKVSGAGFR